MKGVRLTGTWIDLEQVAAVQLDQGNHGPGGKVVDYGRVVLKSGGEILVSGDAGRYLLDRMCEINSGSSSPVPPAAANRPSSDPSPDGTEHRPTR